MSVLTPNEACTDLAQSLRLRAPSAWSANRDFESLLSRLKSAASSPSNPKTGIAPAMQELAKFLGRVIDKDADEIDGIIKLLADTTRDIPFWRPLFGLDTKAGTEENRIQTAGNVAPDCVLEVARRIVSQQWSEFSSSRVRSALRLIANCCADNNVNRSVIVRRDGIAALMKLADLRQECDLLMPTIYNICIDYDDPAVDEDGKPWPSLQQGSEPAQSSTEPYVNAAEQKLGSWHESESGFFSLQTLLYTSHFADPSSLADILEMASRVALYGIHNVIHHLDGTEADDFVEASTIGLIYQLITEGSAIASSDPESCAAILQTILNILSQKAVHGAVLSIDGALWQLVNLPYLHSTAHDPEVEATLLPYRKAVLKLVYEMSSTETYGNKFNPDSELVKLCVDTLQQLEVQGSVEKNKSASSVEIPYASILVLLSNTIISTDRPERLLKTYPNLTHHLAQLINNFTDPEIVHPAIDLAARLALCNLGQTQLHSSRILVATQKFLAPTSEANAAYIDIQRNVVDLARLIIKGKASHLDSLTLKSLSPTTSGSTQQTTFITSILHLFQKTTDSATKLGISRLTIEILRTLVSSSTPTSQPNNNTTTDDKAQVIAHLDTILRTIFPLTSSSSTSTVSPADLIAYIITQSSSSNSTSQLQSQLQPQSPSTNSTQEPESWFGLALLSTFPSYHSSILCTLSRNNFYLLTRLQDIVAMNTNTNTHTNPSNLPPSSSSTSTSTLSSSLLPSTDLTASHHHPQPPSQPPTGRQHATHDARFANIKALVVRLVQTSSSNTDGDMDVDVDADEAGQYVDMVADTDTDTDADTNLDLALAREILESVAADLSVDWVLV